MGFRKTEAASLFTRKPIYNLLKLGLTPRLQVDFPKINGPTHCCRSRPHKLVATSFMLWICQVCQVCVVLRKLDATFFSVCSCSCWSRPNVFCSDDSGCDNFLLFQAVDVATIISYRDLIVLSFVEIYVATLILGHDIHFVVSYVDLCCDNVFLAP